MAVPARVPARVLVRGTGLIGTSLALALRDKGTEVFLSDADPATARLAADLGAGTVLPDLRDGKGIADVAVLAMPPALVGEELSFAQECAVADLYTDVASVKVLPVARARALGCDLESFVPGHPLAGRERHGPAAAQADLFLGRTWALCPLPETSPHAMDVVTALVVAGGADPVVTDAATHDRWVALVSHAPHLVATAMAARLAPADVPGDALRLAGQGLRDVTRVAAGDSALWTQILSANAGPVAEVVAAVAQDLAEVARLLAPLEPPADCRRRALSSDTRLPAAAGRGDRAARPWPGGVGRIPGKHGGQPRKFTVVQVVIADRPASWPGCSTRRARQG